MNVVSKRCAPSVKAIYVFGHIRNYGHFPKYYLFQTEFAKLTSTRFLRSVKMLFDIWITHAVEVIKWLLSQPLL